MYGSLLVFQNQEVTAFDGVMIWKIKDYKRRKNDAVRGRQLSIYSHPFYTSRYGYKLCLRVRHQVIIFYSVKVKIC